MTNSYLQFCFSHSSLYKGDGNWVELTFAKTSGIVTRDVSYWPVFSLSLVTAQRCKRVLIVNLYTILSY